MPACECGRGEDSVPAVAEIRDGRIHALSKGETTITVSATVDGIEKIASDGDITTALDKARTLNEMIDGAVGEIAEDIAAAD